MRTQKRFKNTPLCLFVVATALTFTGGCKPAEENATSATESSTSTTTTLSGSESESASDSAEGTTAATAATSESSGEGTTSSSTSETSTSGDEPSECGNGVVEGPEQCDLGPENADNEKCTSVCLDAVCGDSFIQDVLGEQCDNGYELNNDHNSCLGDCTKASCGDNKLWIGVEECDQGEDNQAGVYGKCDPITCAWGEHCGDGITQFPYEECDLGEENGSEDGACSEMCTLAGNMVFATSASFPGQIGAGGIEAADAACVEAAANAKIANASAFRAWISDGEHSPANWNPKPAGPFILPNTTIIAASWSDLVDGELAAPIDVLETGSKVDATPFYAWTGTHAEGTTIEAHCSKWSSDGKQHKGVWGRLGAADDGWTEHGVTYCQQLARLICIEQ